MLTGHLYAAVVSDEIESDRVLTTVRYSRQNDGSIIKLDSDSADKLLKNYYPHYLYHSALYDVSLHGIPVQDINQHIKASQAFEDIQNLKTPDHLQGLVIKVSDYFIHHGVNRNNIGITGSLALGLHGISSDIDFVIYGRNEFHKARTLVRQAIADGKLNQLNESLWLDAYQRRQPELSYQEYLFHESRKFNKFSIENYKVDISMVLPRPEQIRDEGNYRKIRSATILTRVIDDQYSYDLPARYLVDHDEIHEILCYTVTYAGQAHKGEIIEAKGKVEVNESGKKRLIIGTSREANDEYIRLNQGLNT